MEGLKGKRALVCGSSQGIGRACAQELARLGASVTLAARSESALKQAQDSLETESGARHGFIVADFSDPAALQQKVTDLVATTGPFQILVNNTGGPPSGPIIDAAPQDFVSAVTNHVCCNHILVQALLPGMKESGYGRIINIISTSVVAPIPGLGVSNTTRAAVANWARTVAGELGPFGITVNNVLPGFTDTDRLRSLLKKMADRTGKTEKQVVEDSQAKIPLRRFADPDEIAAVVGFLASPAASYVSGVNLPVDGGRTATQ
jgi:3-oxoacyl-[acyl-carrier protein] reductase